MLKASAFLEILGIDSHGVIEVLCSDMESRFLSQ